MPSPGAFIFGPWRAVSVLGITQILSWGALFYPPVLTVPLIAADHGWSPAFAMAGFSVGLFVGGLCARYVGGAIDRFGGHVVMPIGSLIGAAGLVALVWAPGVASYFAAWTTIGVAMAASLYDPAFATLGRIFGSAARAPITVLTLAGGFASTVSWPATQFLIQTVGWRGAYLVYATLLAALAAPLLLLRCRANLPAVHRATWRRPTSRPKSSCPRMALLFFTASAWRRRPLSRSACCLVQRRSWRGSVNCRLRGGYIHYGSRAVRSACWSRLSCCWRCCRFPQPWRRYLRSCLVRPMDF